jgi:hypothetical protein
MDADAACSETHRTFLSGACKGRARLIRITAALGASSAAALFYSLLSQISATSAFYIQEADPPERFSRGTPQYDN